MASNEEGIVRRARPSDADAIAHVHIASSEEAYSPLAKHWPAADPDARRAAWATWLDASRTDTTRVDLVAEVAGNVVAFVGAGPARRSDVGAEVEVYVIHVLPEHRGAGLGHRLWTEACQSVRGDMLRSMYVATLAELRCCAFYAGCGGIIASRSPRDFHGGAVTDVVYLWPTGCPSEPRSREPRPS